MPNLHPAVDRLLHSGQFVTRPKVEGFTEHVLRDKKGNVTVQVTKDDLEKIAKVNNSKAAQGALTPIGPGHTFDDDYDADGKLARKFPEEKQPKPFGYLYNFRVEQNPHTGKYSLYHDEYIHKQIEDEGGNKVDGMQYSATFPRRSAEIYHREKWIDWMAAIRRAPRLDLGVVMYSKADPEHTTYARADDGNDCPVHEFAKGKFRYSMDTGAAGDDIDDDQVVSQDPTVPATAEATPEQDEDVGGVDVAGEPELGQLHREAAEDYARHTFGMHHTRAKALMQHMHKKYAAECGMDGDMNTEYAMAGPSNVLPTSGGTSAIPQTDTAKPEMTRMQKDQANIEKERYERRLADLEARAAAAEEKEFYSHMQRELMQLVYEEYPINADEELELCKTRKYSREQFDNHIADTRRLLKGYRSPVGDMPPLAIHREFKAPSAGVSADRVDGSTMSDEDFTKVQRYMRQTGCSWEDAKAKYSKTA